MNNKRGFTLSEVMVTMGVLGILAAILIPAIMNTQPDTNRVMFKKAYSTLEKITSELINNETYYPATETDTTTEGVAKVQRGFNYTGNATAIGVPAGQSKFCYLFTQKLNTIGTVNCASALASTNITTSDGIIWTIPITPFPFNHSATSYMNIVVDTNGNKKPNCRRDSLSNTCGSTIKKDQTPDQHVIGVRYDGKIQVYPTAATDDIDAGTILTDPTRNQK